MKGKSARVAATTIVVAAIVVVIFVASWAPGAWQVTQVVFEEAEIVASATWILSLIHI